jgi:hypothetical protein
VPPAAEPGAWPSGAAASDEFKTLTLARIYESQGYLEKALQIYDELRRKHPENAEVASRLANLQRRLAGLDEVPSPAPPAASTPAPLAMPREPADEESQVEWRLVDRSSLGGRAEETAQRLREVTDGVRAQERARRHRFIGPPPAPPRQASESPGAVPSEPLDEVSQTDLQRFLDYVRSLKR